MHAQHSVGRAGVASDGHPLSVRKRRVNTVGTFLGINHGERAQEFVQGCATRPLYIAPKRIPAPPLY